MIRRRILIAVLLLVPFGLGWWAGRGRATADLYENLDLFIEVLNKVDLNGLAETLKHGFIRDPDLLIRLEAVRSRLFRDLEMLSDIIHRAQAIKAQVVAADEKEADLRRILNFGHTLGHALEAASRFRLPHGQAVAWGMLATLDLSRRLTGLSSEKAAYGQRLIKDFGLARTFPKLDLQEIFAALTLDKKRQGQNLVFVLLEDLGKPVIRSDAPPALIAESLETWSRVY